MYRRALSFVTIGVFFILAGTSSLPTKAVADGSAQEEEAPGRRSDAEPESEKAKKKPAWKLSRQKKGVSIYLDKDVWQLKKT
jgi:hypothetical protein